MSAETRYPTYADMIFVLAYHSGVAPLARHMGMKEETVARILEGAWPNPKHQHAIKATWDRWGEQATRQMREDQERGEAA